MKKLLGKETLQQDLHMRIFQAYQQQHCHHQSIACGFIHVEPQSHPAVAFFFSNLTIALLINPPPLLRLHLTEADGTSQTSLSHTHFAK